MKEKKFYKFIYLAATKIQFRSSFDKRHSQKGCGTEQNDFRRKNPERFKASLKFGGDGYTSKK